MALRLSDADASILVALADYHVLTLAQMACLLERNANSLRRRLSALADEGMVRVFPRQRHGIQGRPEHLVTLAEGGYDLLHACRRLPRSIVWEPQSGRRTQNCEHELLINDLRVQLIQLQRFLPVVEVRYFRESVSCNEEPPETTVSIHEKICPADGTEPIEFTPDGVFSLTHRELEKTLLFFLEADRATEPLSSARGGARGLSAKFAAYQAFLRVEQYKRYEEILGANLRGFRLLMLVDGTAGFAALCRLVRDSPPSEFIWLTSRSALLRHGCWAAIWTAGGRITEAPQSILGSKMPQPCPAPSDLSKRRSVASEENKSPRQVAADGSS